MNRREAIKKTGLALGFAVTSPLLMHLIQSCDSKKPLGWKPQFFNEKQALLVAALANQILPKTRGVFYDPPSTFSSVGT